MLHTFVAYVEDLPGVLTRVASLFRRLNININSLTVGRSERPGLSRLTLVCEASAEAGTASAPACLNWRTSSMLTTWPRRRA